jgi:DNA replication protein DnaC
LGLKLLSAAECNEFLELFEDRFNTGLTIISSQLPLEHWNHALTDPTLTDAILDRIVHNAHKIFLKGESMRKTESNLSSNDNDSLSQKTSSSLRSVLSGLNRNDCPL